MLVDNAVELLSGEHQEFAVANGYDRCRSRLFRDDGHLAHDLMTPDFGHGCFHTVELLDLDTKPACREDVEAIGGIPLPHQYFAGSQIDSFAAIRKFVEEQFLLIRKEIGGTQKSRSFRCRLRLYLHVW